MSALSVSPPYPIFSDADGQPLEDGYVWLGLPNQDPQVNATSAYWDAALTQPAPRPIRTLDGYPSNSGTPARIYVNGDYSIRVTDKTGAVVYNAPEATDRFSAAVITGINAVDVAYDPAGSGAVQTNVQAKLRETVSVKDFGAVGDGVADDTAAVHAAIDYAKSRRGTVFFPSGTYRVTSGYTQSTNYADVRLCGEGSTREGAGGSHIQLDSANAASFFYKQAARHHLQVEQLTFSCAQYVLDREFFVFDGAIPSITFENLNFESVEKPIVFKSGIYFQSSTLINVQFRNSGTIHSELGGSLNLRGTLLVLIDVHHEGSVPANSEQIVCNLSGIRQIQATNFLLEGSSPGAGWTGLRLQNPYDADWSRAPMATFHGFWSEWAGGTPLDYQIHQSGGRVVFQSPQMGITSASQYKLDTKGAAEIHNVSFSGTGDPIDTFFDLQDYLCQVAIYDSNARNFGETKTQPNYTLINCSEARNGASLALVGTNFVNTKSQTLWELDRDLLDSGKISFGVFSGTGTPYFSVDATYGRKLVIGTISSTALVDIRSQARVAGVTEPGQQWTFALRMKLPTFASGALQVTFQNDSTSVGSAFTFDASYSGQVVSVMFPCSDTTGGSSLLGFGMGGVLSPTGVSGDLEIYYAAIYLGKDAPHTTIPAFPNFLTNYAAAAPLVGEWKRGDRVYNSVPTVGQPKSWVCTVSGTPGTWVSEGNL